MGIYLVEVREGAVLGEDSVLNLGEHGYASPVLVFSATDAENACAAACEKEGLNSTCAIYFSAKLLAETPHEGEARLLHACWDLSF